MGRGAEAHLGHQLAAEWRGQGAAAGEDRPRGESLTATEVNFGVPSRRLERNWGRGLRSIEGEGKSGDGILRRSKIGFLID